MGGLWEENYGCRLVLVCHLWFLVISWIIGCTVHSPEFSRVAEGCRDKPRVAETNQGLLRQTECCHKQPKVAGRNREVPRQTEEAKGCRKQPRVAPETNVLFLSLPLRVGLGLLIVGFFIPYLNEYLSQFAAWLNKLLPI